MIKNFLFNPNNFSKNLSTTTKLSHSLNRNVSNYDSFIYNTSPQITQPITKTFQSSEERNIIKKEEPPKIITPPASLFDEEILKKLKIYLFGEKLDCKMYFREVKEKFKFIEEFDLDYNDFYKNKKEINIEKPNLIFSFCPDYRGRLIAYKEFCDFIHQESSLFLLIFQY